jgi:DNA-binding transcriptional LysR family regulator
MHYSRREVMNLEQLRTLVDVVEQGSLSAAGRARRLSQPAITKQIQRLEADLGLTLLVRGPGRPVELTPAGERVLAFARQTLAGFFALEQELATLKTVDSGTLTLAASTIPGEYLLPRLLTAFRAEYPHVQVRMSVSDSADVVSHLLADEADVGVVGSIVRRPGLHLERLVEDEILLAVPVDHPFARRQEVAVAELHGQPLLLREGGSGTLRSVESALEAAGYSLDRADVALILGSSQAVIQAVGEGLGLGFVSARAAAQAQADGHLACVRLAGVDMRRHLYLASLPRRAGDPLVAHLVAFARRWVESGGMKAEG